MSDVEQYEVVRFQLIWMTHEIQTQIHEGTKTNRQSLDKLSLTPVLQ